MALGLALKAFFKTFRDKEGAQRFLAGERESDDSLEKGEDSSSHLRLLELLQSSGRLVDFFEEDIVNYSDAQIGAAVRKVHDECHKTLEDYVTIRPVVENGEGEMFNVPVGYDPSEIKLVGDVQGAPPYSGIVKHKGWQAHKVSLPRQVGKKKTAIICPAEVEVKAQQ
ncbi:DUF2760 domain-containing protein [Simkania negevensis]|uniref:DUF2760 domain-containing protein n=1 Tax=Simkania negevensis TaxID=83561 RepID=A0ABS3AVZ9_9BACT|nr:DUF2760 domain-containing protein [Simkania negevensis]